MVVLCVSGVARTEQSFSLIAAGGFVLAFGLAPVFWVCLAAALSIGWLWTDRQEIGVDGSIVTLSRTLFGRRVGRVRTIDTASDISAFVYILLRRRGMSRHIRRIVFFANGRPIARTKILPSAAEARLVAALADEAGLQVRTMEAGRSFPPRIT